MESLTQKKPIDYLKIVFRRKWLIVIPTVIGIIVGIIAGLVALKYTPREEEPQIVVPMLDVLVSAPGLSAEQVARYEARLRIMMAGWLQPIQFSQQLWT